MLLAGAVVLALLVPSQQRAAAKGVFFDPNSPAGKEYALPLDQARDEAAGAGKSDRPVGEKAPLFGEGVSRRGSAPLPAAGGGGASGGSGSSGGSDVGGQGQGPQRLPATAAATAAASSAADDSYALSSAILWVAAILALGGIAGLVLRVLQPPRPAQS
jgi:hypothetical protein